MRRLRTRISAILLERELKKTAARHAIERLITLGAPAGSGVGVEAWRSWHRYGFIACPAKPSRSCTDPRCRIGAACRDLHALGLKGNRLPLPRRKRPICGARNRQGKPCAVSVELGKRRCRFHGGLSMGPRTAAGRLRIAEAQRRRRRAFRSRRAARVAGNGRARANDT